MNGSRENAHPAQNPASGSVVSYGPVRAVLRVRDTDVRAWTADVDVHAEIGDLKDDLVRALGLGRSSCYELTREGSLKDPVLVLRRPEREAGPRT